MTHFDYQVMFVLEPSLVLLRTGIIVLITQVSVNILNKEFT
jgi:hypothetical protein